MNILRWLRDWFGLPRQPLWALGDPDAPPRPVPCPCCGLWPETGDEDCDNESCEMYVELDGAA